MVDTAGCDMEEQAEEDGDSKRNEGEAKVWYAPECGKHVTLVDALKGLCFCSASGIQCLHIYRLQVLPAFLLFWQSEIASFTPACTGSSGCLVSQYHAIYGFVVFSLALFCRL